MKYLSQKQIMILWWMTLVLLSLFGCAGQKPDSGALADRPETTAAPGENWSLSLPQITDEIIRESLTQEKDVLLNGLYIGEPMDEIEKKLGKPDQVLGDFYLCNYGNVQITYRPTEAGWVVESICVGSKYVEEAPFSIAQGDSRETVERKINQSGFDVSVEYDSDLQGTVVKWKRSKLFLIVYFQKEQTESGPISGVSSFCLGASDGAISY